MNERPRRQRAAPTRRPPSEVPPPVRRVRQHPPRGKRECRHPDQLGHHRSEELVPPERCRPPGEPSAGFRSATGRPWCRGPRCRQFVDRGSTKRDPPIPGDRGDTDDANGAASVTSTRRGDGTGIVGTTNSATRTTSITAAGRRSRHAASGRVTRLSDWPGAGGGSGRPLRRERGRRERSRCRSCRRHRSGTTSTV